MKSATIYIINTFIFFVVTACIGQIVPYYPVEVFFNPCGYTNNLPGSDPALYTTFSSLKVVLSKDLPGSQKLANTINMVSNIELYHNLTKTRDYTPFLVNPALKTLFFASDVLTLCLELNGALEDLPGLDGAGTVFKYTNYRYRVRPSTYLIVSPNIIFEQIVTYGRSYNSARTTATDVYGASVQVSRDYNILNYEMTFIYLTPFHTRIFCSPYAFTNQFLDIALSPDGAIDLTRPKLREMGFGSAFGLRYSSFKWGYAEIATEVERNIDVVSNANTYTKFKVNAKWENQYFTERFGFLLGVDFIKYNFVHAVKNYLSNLIDDIDLGQEEVRFDVMPIINLNRNVSLRPEFDFVYKNMVGQNDMMKYRYWLHVHVLF